MEVVGLRRAPAAFTSGKESRCPWYRRRNESLGGSGRVRKISPPTGIRSLDGQARSESLCCLRCLGFVCNVTYLMRSARLIVLTILIAVNAKTYLVSYHCNTTKLFVFCVQTVCKWRNVHVNRWVRMTLWTLAFCACNIFSNRYNIPSHPSIVHFYRDSYAVEFILILKSWMNCLYIRGRVKWKP